LRVLVVNEPELAEAINRLRGEWAERSGGKLGLTATTWKELSAAKVPDADVIVFPSRYLGELCIRDWLRPVRPSVLENEEVNAADIFPLVRERLIAFDGQTMALPLGLDPATIMPDVAKQPAISLLAELAPAAISENREGVLFDTQTMQPRIAETAFVEALNRLTSRDDAATSRPRDSRPIPVLGFNDRLTAVTATSRNAASAFQFLAWLAQPDTSSQLAKASARSLPVRRSLATSPAWYDASLSAGERSDLGRILSTALGGQQSLHIPRIPGVDEYMAALDEAVKSAVVDKVPPQTALDNAAQQWEKITEDRGRDAQRKSYLKHLGISEP
jgi:hypothetical protein